MFVGVFRVYHVVYHKNKTPKQDNPVDTGRRLNVIRRSEDVLNVI